MTGRHGIRSVLFLAPESPYPLHGGGQYRTASLLHYFAEFAEVDLILISESGKAALLPPGLIRNQIAIPLPPHRKDLLARYLRNARRALVGVPPLIDRLSGLEGEIGKAIAQKKYDLGVVEHFWMAPYVHQLAPACRRTVLDLHNVESVLHESCAKSDGGLVSAGHRRFASVARKLETDLLPRFSLVLATSEPDRTRALHIAPAARVCMYPNALPLENYAPDAPSRTPFPERPRVVFSGNFEYHPNIDAVRFLIREIWPVLHRAMPEVRLRLVGKGDNLIRHLLPPEIEVTGPLEDTRPEIKAADVVIAPLRMGSGTRIKILEAWALSRAVVATPLAAEGLHACSGRNILLAETGQTLAEAILQLLANRQERESLGIAGRSTFAQEYTWEQVWNNLDRYLQVISSEEVNRYTV